MSHYSPETAVDAAPAPAAPDQPPPLDELLCFAVHVAGLVFDRVYRPLLQDIGLTYPQFLVMVTLWGEDGVTVGCLCRRLFLETSTLTPLLKRLEALGMLTRRRSDADERRVIVKLTDKGSSLRNAAAAVTRHVAESAGLAPAELAGLTGELHTLRANLERAAG